MRRVLTEERAFGGRTAPYTLREVKGARKITVRVTHNGVVVTKPRWVARRDVDDFLAKCDKWLQRELAKWGDFHASTLTDCVLYQGTERAIREASAPPVRLAGDEFWSHGDGTQQRLAHVLDWMRRRARPTIRESVARWSQQVGVAPKRVAVRDQVSCWGSCSASGALSFNWRLVMAPCAALEYIVVHELCHIREPNHSRKFWSLVAHHCPDFREHEDWLTANTQRVLFTGRVSNGR